MFFAPAVRTARFVPRSFDRNFERFVNEAFLGTPRAPKIEHDDTSWTLSLDVPGLAREDLSIGIEGTVVRIHSTADAKRQVKAAYELPQPIDAAASQAKLENGVLTLTLGKQKTVNNVTQIVIN